MPNNGTNKPKRKSIRLQKYNYSSPGIYFITICTRNRVNMFGNIANGKMILNKYGIIVFRAWQYLQHQYNYIQLDAYVIMPNHFHAVIMICRGGSRSTGGSRTAPTGIKIVGNEKSADYKIIKYKPLGRLIGVFKTVSTKHINKLRAIKNVPIWQRNYYERIIRNKRELHNIRQYIYKNPVKWQGDEFYYP